MELSLAMGRLDVTELTASDGENDALFVPEALPSVPRISRPTVGFAGALVLHAAGNAQLCVFPFADATEAR